MRTNDIAAAPESPAETAAAAKSLMKIHLIFRLVAPLLVLLTGFAAMAAARQAHHITMPDSFAFRSGDDLRWASPEFDDHDWQHFATGAFPRQQWQEIGWFRYWIEIDSARIEESVGVQLGVFGACEFYLDGKLQFAVGEVGSSAASERLQNVRVFRTIALPAGAGTASTRHLVAIRYGNHLLSTMEWGGRSPGFFFQFSDDLDALIEARYQRNRLATAHQMLLTGIFVTFALLHGLIYYYYPRWRAHLYYAGLAASGALLVFLDLQDIFVTDPLQEIWLLRFTLVGGTLLMIFALRFTHQIVYERNTILFKFFFVVGILLTLTGWLQPYRMNTVLTFFWLIAVLELVRSIVSGYWQSTSKPMEGSNILALGALPLCIAGAYQFLIGLGVLPQLWDFAAFPTPYYAMCILMLAMSIFLARSYARSHRDLEAQLEQVRMLSEQTVQQEVERAKLASENERKSRELEEARQLQLSMLPKTVPSVPGLELAVHMQTATEVGGDYYDFRVDGNGGLTLAIGDATGHGLQAGTMVAASKSLFNALAHEPEPAQILRKASHALKAMGFRSRFMAMTIAKFDGRHMRVAAAGMPFIQIYRTGQARIISLELKGMPLGSFPDFDYDSSEQFLHPGDALLFMSDGFSELMNRSGEMFGDERIRSRFAELAELPARQIIDGLLQSGFEWAEGKVPHDDITFIVVKVTGDG